jgi:hypothetical protein
MRTIVGWMKISIGLAAVCGLPFHAAAGSPLNFDFNDSAHLEVQTGPLPKGEVSGAVSPSKEFPGSADFAGSYEVATAGGVIRVPGYRQPKGPFSIEGRFRLRSYGPEDSRFVADILNTATWDEVVSQGFAFRVGGSYLYPPLPRNAYKTEAEWTAAQNAWSHIDRGRMSDCFAVFAIAQADDPRAWKQVITDRCIELNAWTHLVATWDGEDMRIFLNGTDATDPWRIQGKGHAPLMDSVVDAFVGARNTGTWDPRHVNGAIDFVRVEEGVLSDAEIHKRYKETFKPEVHDSLCLGVIIPHYPVAGQVCDGKVDFEIKVINHGACTDPAFLASFLAGDSVEVEFAKNSSFTDVVLRVVVSTTAFRLQPSDLAKIGTYKGQIFWRVRLVRSKAVALAKSSVAPTASLAETGEWSPSRPMILDLTAPTSLAGRASGSRPILVQSGSGLFVADDGSGSRPFLYDLAGHRQSARFERVPGGWRLEKAGFAATGLVLIGR